MHHFREQSEISTWIYRIAVNKSLDFIRRKKRKKRFAQLVSLFSGSGGESIDPPAALNPHRELEDRERQQILKQAVEKLPDNQRTAITLSRYEGFNNKEIAAIMDLSLSAVEALLHRAKKNLHKHLSVYFEKNL